MAENLAKVVSQESIVKAIEEIIENQPKLIPSTKFDLVYNGIHFPPKEVIRKAAQIQGIEDWQAYRLSGGESSSRHLIAKGFNIQPKATITKYYLGGVVWGDQGDQTKRFIEDGTWENGFDNKFVEEVKSIPVGSLFALKSAYAKGKDSYLRVKCIGEVVGNPGTGRILYINWDKIFQPVDYLGLGGYYMRTLHEVTNPNHVDIVFNGEEPPKHTTTEPLNTILYGPPGTGKTYNTIDHALYKKAFRIFSNRLILNMRIKQKNLFIQFV